MRMAKDIDKSTRMNRRTFLAAGAGTLVSRVQQNRDLRSRIAGDRHRLQYHIVPPANFLNDPNGPLFWKGKYHIFYQYAPGGDMFSTKYWYHAVWKDGDDWYMIIGAGGREANAMLPFYRSRDLRHWEYLRLFAAAKPESTPAAGGGRMWECPDFFFLGGKPVLIVNVQNSYFT